MLTTELEKLILKGKAIWKTTTVGASGMLNIEVAKDRYIVITDFKYFHFIDPNFEFVQPDQVINSIQDLEAYLKRSIHQIRFESKKSSNTFVIKEPVILSQVQLDGSFTIVNCNGHIGIDTYMIHENDVRIEISGCSGGLIIHENIAQSGNKFRGSPAGYGTNSLPAGQQVANPVQVDFTEGAGHILYPQKFDPKTSGTHYNRLQFPYDDGTALNHTEGEAFWRYECCVIVNYVEILESLPPHIQGK